MVKIKNWSIGYHPDENPYNPPECRITGSTGRVVQTYSRDYELVGPPDPEYMKFIASLGRTIDDANPIKVISRAN